MFRPLKHLLTLLACIVMMPSSFAQDIFDDNELRTGIIEIAEQIIAEERQVAAVSDQIARLDTELEALRTLILELQKNNGKLDGDNQKRDKRLKEIAVRLDNEISSAQSTGEDLLKRLEMVMSGFDAQEFRRAIDRYKSGASPEETQMTLKEIQALGELSNFSAPALYWSGLINYDSGETLEAREKLTEYLERYPAAQHVPNAMLLLANIAAESNDPSQGKWEDLILKLYPASTAAKVIRDQRSS